jgi:hypothetical protein
VRWLLAAALACAAPASAEGIVVLSAPSAKMRAAAKAALEGAKYTVIDASDIDHDLFGGAPKLGKAIPAEVRQDYQQGAAACRGHDQPTLLPDCLRGVSQVVWQRYLERVGAERVVEFQPPEPGFKARLTAICATYQPKNAWVATGAIGGKDDAELGGKAVKILESELKLSRGVRPNSNLLPGPEKLRIPSLDDGVEQELPPLELRKPCTAPLLSVSPSTSPLARTVALLYRASLGDHVRGTTSCSLRFDQVPGRYPEAVTLSCGSSSATYALYPSMDFTAPAYQADLARALVGLSLAQQCQ